jgi:ABC-type uncharacterized transport system ATPase subunit
VSEQATLNAPQARISASDGVSRLEASHLAKAYGSRKVVKDVSLVVRKGEVVGPSWSQWGGQDHLLLHDRRPGATQRR